MYQDSPDMCGPKPYVERKSCRLKNNQIYFLSVNYNFLDMNTFEPDSKKYSKFMKLC